MARGTLGTVHAVFMMAVAPSVTVPADDEEDGDGARGGLTPNVMGSQRRLPASRSDSDSVSRSPSRPNGIGEHTRVLVVALAGSLDAERFLLPLSAGLGLGCVGGAGRAAGAAGAGEATGAGGGCGALRFGDARFGVVVVVVVVVLTKDGAGCDALGAAGAVEAPVAAGAGGAGLSDAEAVPEPDAPGRPPPPPPQ